MLKRTITYKDLFSDEEVVEEFYFHLSVAELMELNVEYEGGIQDAINRMAKKNDLKGLYYFIKDFILASYGIRTGEDGKFFTKTQELRDQFAASEAYSSLLMELGSSAEKSAQFFNAIVPQDLAEQAEKLERANLLIARDNIGNVTPIDEKKNEPEVISRSDFAATKGEEFSKLLERIRTGDVVIKDEPDPTAS